MNYRPKAVFINEHPNSINYVYSAEQIRKIGKLVNLETQIIGSKEIATMVPSEAEIAFSTWGMTTLSEKTLAEKFPKLKVVFYSAGATDYFVRPFFNREIAVISAWQANAIPVAEFCVAQILLALKGYFRVNRSINSSSASWNDSRNFVGPGVYGETVALIGAGAISTRIKELLSVFSVKVIVVPSRLERRTVSIEEAFKKAFVVSNHLPNRNDNIGVLNGKLFSSMRPGAVFINTGRGAQVNEEELIEVLEQRPDLTALLDVTHPEPPLPNSKFYTLENVQLSSHIAGSMNDEVHRMSDYMIEELENYISGRPFRHQVTENMLLTN